MIIGTRGSKLALAQALIVQKKLRSLGIETKLKIIKTRGDKITDRPLHAVSGFGAFVCEIDEHMLADNIDIAVHSMKDVPTERPEELTIAAVLKRDSPYDALLTRDNVTLEELPEGTVIGTASLRRRSQLLRYRKDIVVKDIRGNIDTRLRKLHDGEYDGIILAEAGLNRMKWDLPCKRLYTEHFCPSANQGSIAAVTRKNSEAESTVKVLDHQQTRIETEVERIIISVLGGGCVVPIAAFAKSMDEYMHVTAEVLSIDGKRYTRVEENITLKDYAVHAQDLGEKLKKSGGYELINEAKKYFSHVRGET